MTDNDKIYRLLIPISLFAISGAIIYKAYALDWPGVLLSTAITAALSYYIMISFLGKKNKGGEEADVIKTSRKELAVFTSYIALYAGAMFLLWSSATTEAIISPWERVNKLFFPCFIALTLVAYAAAIRNSKYFHAIALLQYFLSFSVALIVYKIGFGFDPFVHIATEKLIDLQGYVDPKPLYYLGQYALVSVIHKFTSIPISVIDKFLLISISSFFLPFSLFLLCKKFVQDVIASKMAILSILIIPYPFFINTTPQGLAFFFLILTIVSSLEENKKLRSLLPVLFSLASLSFQPIAGIPAILYAASTMVSNSEIKPALRNASQVALFFGFSLVLPILFLMLDKGSWLNYSARDIDLHYVTSFFASIQPRFAGQEDIILNSVYFLADNFHLIFIAIVAIALIATRKDPIIFKRNLYAGIAGTGISLLLTALLPFNFLIDYEKDNYIERLFFIAAMFSFPFIAIFIARAMQRISSQEAPVKLIFILFLTFLSTATLYLSYPRLDNYRNSHGLSTGADEIAGVRWIDEDGRGNNYIVLANQQVSAAALHEYGFSKYYKNDIFYYPIPTSMPLYQYYLRMVNEYPAAETMREAMDYAGTDTAYFVLNKYWWASSKIKEEAKLTADSYHSINNDQVMIFKFSK